VAHEVRNPLASIKTSIQMLREELMGDGETPEITTEQVAWSREAIGVVLKEVERLDTIVRDLLLFAKPRQLHRSQANLSEICERVLGLLQAQCVETNVVVHRVYEETPLLWIDIGQMEQVLWNIFMNAIQAMSDGGVLTVSCHVVPHEMAFASVQIPSPPSPSRESRMMEYSGQGNSPEWLELTISDTGMGIPPEQLERIFQPFFTTKAHGIGLGLAITKRLIEDHGGTIKAEGQFGYGTTVSIRLPITKNVNEGQSDYSKVVED
jgi:signal transduction histidine kinase